MHVFQSVRTEKLFIKAIWRLLLFSQASEGSEILNIFYCKFFTLQRTYVDLLFPKCQTHAYTRFENGCSENSTQNLLTKYSTEEKNKHVICRPRSVRIGKTVPEVLSTYSRPLDEFFPARTSRPANNIYVC